MQAPTPFPGNRIPANRIHPVSQAAARLLSAAAAGSHRLQLRERRSAARQCRPIHLPARFHPEPKSSWFFRHSISHELGYDPFPIPDMGINTDTDVQQAVLGNTPHVRIEQAERLPVRVRQPEERPHLAARQHRQRGRAPRHQPAERQPALLGRAEHRHHRPRRASAKRATRRSSTTTRRCSSSTTSPGRSPSTRSSSAASCGTCATTRSAAS